MTDFASTNYREYNSWRGQILQQTHQGQISRSKVGMNVFSEIPDEQ